MNILSNHRPGRHAMGATLLRCALIAAFAFAPQATLAKTAAKKGAHGAIALQRETGQFGYIANATTVRAAKIEALKQCVDPRCEVVLSFSNACGVLARNPARGLKEYISATGATQQEAETKALRLCADKACTVLVWACTK